MMKGAVLAAVLVVAAQGPTGSIAGSVTDAGVQAFSRVFLTRDRLHALVEYSHSCGTLCGEGALLWLGRPAVRSDAWTIRGRGLLWVS